MRALRRIASRAKPAGARINPLVPREAETLALLVKMTGQNGTANAGDIVCQGFSVEIID